MFTQPLPTSIHTQQVINSGQINNLSQPLNQYYVQQSQQQGQIGSPYLLQNYSNQSNNFLEKQFTTYPPQNIQLTNAQPLQFQPIYQQIQQPMQENVDNLQIPITHKQLNEADLIPLQSAQEFEIMKPYPLPEEQLEQQKIFQAQKKQKEKNKQQTQIPSNKQEANKKAEKIKVKKDKKQKKSHKHQSQSQQIQVFSNHQINSNMITKPINQNMMMKPIQEKSQIEKSVKQNVIIQNQNPNIIQQVPQQKPEIIVQNLQQQTIQPYSVQQKNEQIISQPQQIHQQLQMTQPQGVQSVNQIINVNQNEKQKTTLHQYQASTQQFQQTQLNNNIISQPLQTNKAVNVAQTAQQQYPQIFSQQPNFQTSNHLSNSQILGPQSNNNLISQPLQTNTTNNYAQINTNLQMNNAVNVSQTIQQYPQIVQKQPNFQTSNYLSNSQTLANYPQLNSSPLQANTNYSQISENLQMNNGIKIAQTAQQYQQISQQQPNFATCNQLSNSQTYQIQPQSNKNIISQALTTATNNYTSINQNQMNLAQTTQQKQYHQISQQQPNYINSANHLSNSQILASTSTQQTYQYGSQQLNSSSYHPKANYQYQ